MRQVVRHARLRCIVYDVKQEMHGTYSYCLHVESWKPMIFSASWGFGSPECQTPDLTPNQERFVVHLAEDQRHGEREDVVRSVSTAARCDSVDAREISESRVVTGRRVDFGGAQTEPRSTRTATITTAQTRKQHGEIPGWKKNPFLSTKSS